MRFFLGQTTNTVRGCQRCDTLPFSPARRQLLGLGIRRHRRVSRHYRSGRSSGLQRRHCHFRKPRPTAIRSSSKTRSRRSTPLRPVKPAPRRCSSLDQSRFDVGPNATVKLDSFVYDPASSTGGGQINMARWRVPLCRRRHEERGRHQAPVTPTATMTIRGSARW